MSNDERRVFWVRPHVRKRADGTEYLVKGHFVGDPERGPYVTKTGKVLTDEDIQALADEAEKGYDLGDEGESQ